MKPIPSPSGHFLWGHLNEMRQDFLQFLVNTSRNYGPIAQFRAGPARMVVLTNPDDIADVLVKRAELFHKTRSTKRLLAALLGDGLISREAEAHRQHRRIMQPAFHQRQVQNYTQTILTQTTAWLIKYNDGDILDTLPAFAQLTLSIVIQTFFSAQVEDIALVRQALQSFSEALDLRVRSPIPLPQWLPTHHNRVMRRALTTMDDTIYRLIAQRRRQANPPQDLLTMLLNTQDEETGEALTDTEVRDEIATIFFAGYETTTTTLTWVWYLLATHPDIYTALITEVKTILNSASPSAGELSKMVLLDRVLKETLRLYPAAWLFDRQPIEDVQIGDYIIPRGQTIFISPYLVHRHPDNFDAPDEFRPQRFESPHPMHRFAYFPFGGGPRICIGQAFAQHTLMLIMATLLPRLRLTLLPEQMVRPAAAATLVPDRSIKMRVQFLS